MRLLLDTHLLLWAAATPERLSDEVRERIASRKNEVLFSAASIWELAIKAQSRRAPLGVLPEEIAWTAAEQGFEELPVLAAHAARVRRLPPHHRDPFDRLLIAQALHEPLRLLTADRVLAEYSDLVEVVE